MRISLSDHTLSLTTGIMFKFFKHFLSSFLLYNSATVQVCCNKQERSSYACLQIKLQLILCITLSLTALTKAFICEKKKKKGCCFSPFLCVQLIYCTNKADAWFPWEWPLDSSKVEALNTDCSHFRVSVCLTFQIFLVHSSVML